MKKTIFILSILITIFFSACTKKYSCKCTTTLTQDGYYPKKTETIEEIKNHSSKKKATQICGNTETQMQANTRLLFPDYITVGTNCELKDY
jgi:hypothetical protein